jgi:hypothetical protein
MRRTLCVAMGVLLLGAGAAGAQDASAAAAGPAREVPLVTVAGPSLAADAMMAAPPELPATGARGTRGALVGGAIGLVVGAAIGVAHGALDHPGLPHHGDDLPNIQEYSPYFALAGLVIGAVLGAR